MDVVETVHAEPRGFLGSPVYRVHFWQHPPPGYGWPLEAYVLTEAEDIIEVLNWVEEHARGRRVEVFAELDEEPVGAFTTPRKTRLLCLLGSNPNAEESVTVEIGRFVKEE